MSGREGAGAAGSSSHTAGAREHLDDGKELEESEKEVWSNGKLVERSKGRVRSERKWLQSVMRS